MRGGYSREAGDTLVEVLLGLTILSAVLITSFSTATAAFRLGQNAKERTIAGDILQEQAEALRNFRDVNADSWTTTESGVTGVVSPFHMEKVSSNWTPVGGPLDCSDPIKRVIYCNKYDKFTIKVTPTTLNLDLLSGTFQRINLDLVATWQGQGISGLQTETISTAIVDISSLNPCRGNVAGGCALP